LLNNAIKFTERGKVRVRVSLIQPIDMGVMLHFMVSDTGVGIEREKQALIFEPFTQADGSITRKYGGTGLGVTISRRLVEKFGGKLWLESEPGVGSIFHFTAPLGLASPIVTAKRLAAPVKLPPLRDFKSGLRILLAEDNSINQKVLTRILEKHGCFVTVVENGQQAGEQAATTRFDVILMDLQMPVLDGLSATMAIRAREKATGQHVPIIALTGHAMRGERENCIRAGMDEYLAKPVDTAELWRLLARLVGTTTALPEVAPSHAPAEDRKATIDWNAALDMYDHDREFLQEISTQFLQCWPITLTKLSDALAAGNAERLAAEAHALKGAAAQLATKEVVLAAQRLELIGKCGELAEATFAIQELTAAVQCLQVYLKKNGFA